MENIYVNLSNDWSYLISVAVIQALQIWELGLHIKINFFLAAWDLHCGMWAFSGLGERASLVVEHGPYSMQAL